MNIINLARLMVSFLFVYCSINDFIHMDLLVLVISERGLPLPDVVFLIGVCSSLIAGGCLMFKYQIKWAVIVLIVFVVLATLVFHDFWHATGDFHRLQCISFVTNISTIGALLLVYVTNK